MDQLGSYVREAMMAGFARALDKAGLDPALAHAAEYTESGFAGINVTHAARYTLSGQHFFTVGEDAYNTAQIDADMDRAVADIVDYTAHAADILAACRRIRDHAAETLGPAGIRHPEVSFAMREAMAGGQAVVTACVSYEGLDDMLATEGMMITVSEPADIVDPAGPLVKAAAAEIRRRARLGDAEAKDALCISASLHLALKALSPQDREEIISRIDTTLINTEEQDDIETYGIGYLSFRDGVLEAAVDLGPASVSGSYVTIPGFVPPVGVAMHLPGRPASAVIDHPFIAGRTIVRTIEEGEGLHLEIDDDPLPLARTIAALERDA